MTSMKKAAVNGVKKNRNATAHILNKFTIEFLSASAVEIIVTSFISIFHNKQANFCSYR